MAELTITEVARELGLSAGTLRRWARAGLVPLPDGRWTRAGMAHARLVARLRERGHSLDEIREASDSGRLAYGYMEDLFPPASPVHSLEQAAEHCGLEPALVSRIFEAAGFPGAQGQEVSEDDLQLLRYVSAVLAAGFPLVALLQLVRVYGLALARIADAEVRLFHLYVHEPLIREGVDNLQMAQEMEGLARELMPLASPIVDHVHQRYMQHFIEQDVVGPMELEVDADGTLDLGRVRVAIAFADLAGYTRLTEEAGEEEAVGLVERFVRSVQDTLPDGARVIKTIGDEVMIVASDASTLLDWAVGFQALQTERPLPRIGLHQGPTLYRDGDYFGRAVNLASRVGARAAGGEVLVTRELVETGGRHLEFDRVGEVKLKGFRESTELFLARRAEL